MSANTTHDFVVSAAVSVDAREPTETPAQGPAQDIAFAGALTFSEDGTLFVGDNHRGAIYAFEIPAAKSTVQTTPSSIRNIDSKLAELLGVRTGALEINDLAVHPASNEIYISVAPEPQRSSSASMWRSCRTHSTPIRYSTDGSRRETRGRFGYVGRGAPACFEIKWRHRFGGNVGERQQLVRKVRGHHGYFGITSKSQALATFVDRVCKLWRRWLDRRSHRAGMDRDRMNILLRRYPLPMPRIVHSAIPA